MTRPSKKEHERRLASRFLEGFDATSLDDGESPDFRVRRPGGDFALEVTEYHSQSPEGDTGRPRVAAEVSWWRYAEPHVNSERQAEPSLRNIQAYFRFNDHCLPNSSRGAAVARELVEAIAAAVANRRFIDKEAEVIFAPRAQIESIGEVLDDTIVLPDDSWPSLARGLRSLCVSRTLLEWPLWNCLNVTTAWLGPEVAEFKRILDSKADVAKNYNLGDLPLWLLIVCELLDDGGEAHGDLASHIFPRNAGEQDQIADVLRQTGFDFQTGPFSEVWLFSYFTGDGYRLHPRS